MKYLAFLLLVALVSAQQQQPQLQPEVEDVQQVLEEEPIHIGELRGSEHSIAGSLYAVDEYTLLLKRFEYDGEAKDAFFWIGTSGSEPNPDGTILPYPFGGIHYSSEDRDAPILYGVFNGSQDVRLILPESFTVSEVKWFSVWSRGEKKSFAEVIFPKGFTLNRKSGSSVNSGFGPTTQSFHSPTSRTTETYSNTDLPHPILSGNVHDPRRVEDQDFADHDGAQPEAEPETTGDDEHDGDHQPIERFQHSRRNSGSGVLASLFTLSFSLVLSKFL